VPEILFEFLRGIRCDSEAPYMQDFCVKKSLGIGFNITDHLLNEMLRFGAGGADKDGIAPANMTEDVF
jgi:hypothetical protein